MHLRYSKAAGTPVVEDMTEEPIGTISGILLHPDLGKVEGFFVAIRGFLHTTELFLPAPDIRHWGSRVRIRDADVLAPIEDHVRLQRLMEEGRLLLLQPIVTESGRPLGICRDVQFQTSTYMLEWIFPRRFFRWGRPIPANAIIEVRPEAIIVREVQMSTETIEGVSAFPTLEALPNAGG